MKDMESLHKAELALENLQVIIFNYFINVFGTGLRVNWEPYKQFNIQNNIGMMSIFYLQTRSFLRKDVTQVVILSWGLRKVSSEMLMAV